MTDRLYYGDNLAILRDHVPDASVDLVYLDPPFNSNGTYNVLFKAPDGAQSQAQIEAFDDTWHWNEKAEDAYWQVLHGPNTDAARMLEAMRSFLGENDMMAYLAMMAIRLIELHRALKPTGSLYLHCDPTASHYLKILLDAVFGKDRFVNEIAWKRYGAHNDTGQGSKHYGRVHDILLFYSKSADRIWNQQYTPQTEDYVRERFQYVDKQGRRYTDTPLTGPGGAEKGNPVYEWNGHTRAWRISRATMQAKHDRGELHYTKTGYVRGKRYLDEVKGVPVQSVWADIVTLGGTNAERLGYPTQKPVALLERIVAASSNPGDLVLDPFCGCGTTVHAAQKLGRRWIGIDVTHLAVSLIERRLRDAFGADADFVTVGVPKDIGAARDLALRDKHEFEKWAITLIPDAQPFRGGKKGADTGIDGVVYMRTEKNRTDKAIVEVKGGAVTVDQVHKLKSVIEREKALTGIFVTLNPPTRQMVSEAAAAGFADTAFGRIPRIQILTIEGLLDHREFARLPAVDSSAFKKAPKEKRDDQVGFEF